MSFLHHRVLLRPLDIVQISHFLKKRGVLPSYITCWSGVY